MDKVKSRRDKEIEDGREKILLINMWVGGKNKEEIRVIRTSNQIEFLII